MKHLVKAFLVAFLVIGLLGACSDNQDQTKSNGTNDGKVAITITKENGAEKVAEKEVTIKENESVMDVIQENFDLEEEAGFITAIEGIKAKEGETKAWFYSVNGENAMVGAKEYKLKDGDQVNFDFHSWE